MTKHDEKKTILVIDDEADARQFTSRVLELEGYCVLTAEDGDEGLRLARERKLDLILLDLKLPGRDGLSVLKEMKSQLRLSVIPVVMFTASAGASQKKKALGLGAVDYLIKPLSAGSLREAVNSILSSKR